MHYTQFTRDERVSLAALFSSGMRQKEIAARIGKGASAISREIARNSDADGVYRPGVAHRKTRERRTRAKYEANKIERNPGLRRKIMGKLRRYWSPEQIAGALNREAGCTVISHETIYGWIYAARPDLKWYLRCQKGKYRRKRGTKLREKQREEGKKTRIDVRPAIVGERTRIGDWEGDTMMGRDKRARILTHVERKSGYLMADKLLAARARDVAERTALRFRKLSRAQRRTATYDNGLEFAEHERIAKTTGMAVYFAHPYHSWERGTNENTNGLLRQFFPRHIDFATITQKDIDEKVRLINMRPRKRHGYLTPVEIFRKNCTSN
ncbi:MAG TPA: IS30 family transposase [Candidatus Paceibacterota bacterium]|nr:IS30 family transposase [Candidatus Paceibacterota bacterium]